MRPRHFETLAPVCPVCRAGGGQTFPLRIARVTSEEDGHILEGALHCTNQNCLREFPILDGIPLIIAGLRQYVTDNALAILARHDLGEFVESMLGDCCGPNSVFEQTRQQVSSYAWDHYGDLDPKETPGIPQPGSVLRNLVMGLELADKKRSGSRGSPATSAPAFRIPAKGHSAGESRAAAGPILDAGCSVGRSTFALAERTDQLVLGVDLHYAMLRLGAEVLRTGTVRYARRRTGLVYDRREFPAHFKNLRNVDFWACDATALPLPAGTFSLALNLNLLDCVSAPRELLVSVGQVLQAGGRAVFTCPYDWSPGATPFEAWLGGHSQRSPLAGSSETVLHSLLTPHAHPGSVNTLKLIAERNDVPWQVRLHERSTMLYRAHLLLAERVKSET